MNEAAIQATLELDSVLTAAKQELLRGHPAGACARLDAVLAAHPGNGPALHLKGIIAASNEEYDNAAGYLSLAIKACPEKITWNSDLAACLAAEGDWTTAATRFSEVLKFFPDNFTALCGYGCALSTMQRFDEAVEVLTRAARLHAEHPGPPRALARVYVLCGGYELARQWWSVLLNLCPEDPEAAIGLMRANWQLGDLDATLAMAERLIRERRAGPEVQPFVLSARLHCQDETTESIRCRAEAFGKQTTQPISRRFSKRPESLHRPLRIGYIGGEFVAGSPTRFLPPIIGNHDRRSFEIFLYHTRQKESDSTTDWYRQFGNWRDCRNMDDDLIRSHIDNDGIDILVDLSGCFPDNALRIFAGRAAPVQITYPNYPATTGVAAMDYIFTDKWTCPPGHESQYTEQPIFLPSGYLAFAPAHDAREVNPLPAQENAFITFGLFQRRLKLNSGVFDAISEVLHRTTGSRLLIQHHDWTLEHADSPNRHALVREFTTRDIAEDRLSLVGPRTHSDTLSVMAQADIALDTFPYQGQTTTCECLWQGVPVIALSGESHVARVGTGILQRVGLGHLATGNVNSYIQCAVDLASDLPALSHLRGGMRDRLSNSTLLNGKNLACEVEAAYMEVWRAWCDGVSA